MFSSLRSRIPATARSYSQASAPIKTPLEKAILHAEAISKLVQERLGSALGAYKEPIFGNAAVAKEVLKQVYVVEKLSPPTLSQVVSFYSTSFNNIKNVSYLKNVIESGQWKQFGIYAIEAYGIFKIGEMIGRRNMVGYALDETKPVVE